MSIGKMAIAVLIACLAVGGGIAALADTRERTSVEPIALRDRDEAALRRDDAGEEILAPAEDDDNTGDGDNTIGNDRTAGGDNTGDGDNTIGNDRTAGGDNTGDGDGTIGNDGTAGGDNSGDGDGTYGNDGTAGGDNTADVTYATAAGSASGGSN
jgi:hypothetical protein